MGSLGGSWHHIPNKSVENNYLDSLVVELRENVQGNVNYLFI